MSLTCLPQAGLSVFSVLRLQSDQVPSEVSALCWFAPVLYWEPDSFNFIGINRKIEKREHLGLKIYFSL